MRIMRFAPGTRGRYQRQQCFVNVIVRKILDLGDIIELGVNNTI